MKTLFVLVFMTISSSSFAEIWIHSFKLECTNKINNEKSAFLMQALTYSFTDDHSGSEANLKLAAKIVTLNHYGVSKIKKVCGEGDISVFNTQSIEIKTLPYGEDSETQSENIYEINDDYSDKLEKFQNDSSYKNVFEYEEGKLIDIGYIAD